MSDLYEQQRILQIIRAILSVFAVILGIVLLVNAQTLQETITSLLILGSVGFMCFSVVRIQMILKQIRALEQLKVDLEKQSEHSE